MFIQLNRSVMHTIAAYASSHGKHYTKLNYILKYNHLAMARFPRHNTDSQHTSYAFTLITLQNKAKMTEGV